ncbi:MAG: carbohydrate ABC transporter permease, partial [Gammaproteobacteria bacterium]
MTGQRTNTQEDKEVLLPRESSRGRWNAGRILAQSFAILLIIASLFPFLFMVRVALASDRDYLSGIEVLWASVTLDNFIQVYRGTDIASFLFNSLLFSALTTVVVLVIGAMAGFGLAKARSAAVRDNIMFFVLSTRMGPPVVFAVPLFLLLLNFALIDTYVGLLIVYIFYNLAFAIWLMYGFFREVPQEIEEAGLLDGLSPLGVFGRISLPQAVPGLIATGIFVFIFTWNEFFYALVLTRETASTFPVAIPQFFGAFRVEWGEMLAASTMGVIP